MNLTLITCTGDRPEAFALAEKYVARQTVKPSQWLVLDDGETGTTYTMGQEYFFLPQFRGRGSMPSKIRWALNQMKVSGDGLVFWEDDDWYSPQYLQYCQAGLAKYDMIGEAFNIYYNVQQRWWFEHNNRFHASLCATALRRSVFQQLERECQSEDPFVDSRLWANCRLSKMPFDPNKAANGLRMTIGIKSMPGRKGYGEGHNPYAARAIQDPELTKLHLLIGDDTQEYAQFYMRKQANVVRPILQPQSLPKIEVHIVAYNEEMILPYTLRHYKTFASRIIIHDGQSTDNTRKIGEEAGAEVREWNTNNQINDTLLRKLKQEAWLGTDADWVIMADADELIYFPNGVEDALKSYEERAVAFVKPYGFEMISDSMPTGNGQLYDEFKHGAPDDKWYAKPIMFSPKRVVSINYEVGAHQCTATLSNGLQMWNPVRFSDPACYLLHYHHLGGVDRIAAKYDANRKRFSEENRKHNWGWNGIGIKHAIDKRNAILAKLQQVIP